jgi:alpha-galactosidase
MATDSNPSWAYIKSIIDTNAKHISHTNFYGHNDMDMMEIGNGNLTIAEQKTHFAAWCFLKSPILLGTDVNNLFFFWYFDIPDKFDFKLSLLNSAQLTIIKNTELLAFHQDRQVGTAAVPFTPYDLAPVTTPAEYYSGKSSRGIHVFIINTSDTATSKTFNFANVPHLSGSSYQVHDMWTSKDLGQFSGAYTTSLSAHDTAAFLITPV